MAENWGSGNVSRDPLTRGKSFGNRGRHPASGLAWSALSPPWHVKGRRERRLMLREEKKNGRGGPLDRIHSKQRKGRWSGPAPTLCI